MSERIYFKKICKNVAAALIALLLVFSVASCAYPAEEQYQNFLLDMDIVTRFDLCIDSVQQERATQYTVDELRTLTKDVDFWSGDFADAQAANENLKNCAAALINCIEQEWDENEEAAKLSLESALDFYSEAKAIIRKNMGNTSV